MRPSVPDVAGPTTEAVYLPVLVAMWPFEKERMMRAVETCLGALPCGRENQSWWRWGLDPSATSSCRRFARTPTPGVPHALVTRCVDGVLGRGAATAIGPLCLRQHRNVGGGQAGSQPPSCLPTPHGHAEKGKQEGVAGGSGSEERQKESAKEEKMKLWNRAQEHRNQQRRPQREAETSVPPRRQIVSSCTHPDKDSGARKRSQIECAQNGVRTKKEEQGYRNGDEWWASLSCGSRADTPNGLPRKQCAGRWWQRRRESGREAVERWGWEPSSRYVPRRVCVVARTSLWVTGERAIACANVQLRLNSPWRRHRTHRVTRQGKKGIVTGQRAQIAPGATAAHAE